METVRPRSVKPQADLHQQPRGRLPVSDQYTEFIRKKSQCDHNDGFEPLWMPSFLFPFQRHLTEWSIRKGRAAVFADCGL